MPIKFGTAVMPVFFRKISLSVISDYFRFNTKITYSKAVRTRNYSKETGWSRELPTRYFHCNSMEYRVTNR